jgi:hypothetical protein
MGGDIVLEKIKFSVRITNSVFDDEVQEFIDACLKDMENIGIDVSDEEDALIIQACKTYARWQYDFRGKGEQYKEAYFMLKNHLSMCGDYISTEEV